MTAPDSPRPDRAAIVRNGRIIAGALMAGVSIFLVVVVVLKRSRGEPMVGPDSWDLSPPQGIIALVGLVLAAGAIPLSFVMPRIIAAQSRRTFAKEAARGDEPIRGLDDAFPMIYLQRAIVGLALLEGVAFFNLIAFLLAGRLPSLIVVAVLLLLMASRFPSEPSLDAFAEDQRALLMEERQAA